MRRFGSFFAVSLLTFLVGVVVARGYALLSAPRSEAVMASAVAPPAPSAQGKVRVTFRRLVEDRYGPYAEFAVFNGGAEPLYYRGYSKDFNCDYKFRHDAAVEQRNPCWCGTGLAERTLLPGESVYYRVNLWHTNGDFDVGFDFLVGAARRKETFWNETPILSAR